MFLGGHPNHQLVFMRIWQIEPSYLTDAFRDFYEASPLNITRILDVAQDLKVSSILTNEHITLTCRLDFGVTFTGSAIHFCLGRCGTRIPQRVLELGQVASRQCYQPWRGIPSRCHPISGPQNGE